jgi:hypothetical protein
MSFESRDYLRHILAGMRDRLIHDYFGVDFELSNESRAGGTRRRDLRRYAEMSEDPLDYGRLLDERDQAQAAAAPRTCLRPVMSGRVSIRIGKSD